MERHPVPQNIMDVEFKLFGALTVRQFAYLAAGCLIALMTYYSPLPPLLQWLFIGVSLGTGFFLSLVKINGQPSTVWVGNFIVSMLEPQARLWRKTPIIPDVLKDEPNKKVRTNDDLVEMLTKERLAKLPAVPLENPAMTEAEQVMDKEEQANLSQIDEHFDFLFKDLPEIPTVSKSVKPDLEPFSKPAENPVINKPATIAAAIQHGGNTNESLYQTENYAVMYKPMQNQVNRPLTVKLAEVGDSANANFVKGIVLGHDESPIAGAQINLLDAKNNIVRAAVSEQNGNFAVATALPAGDYLIDVKNPGNKFPRYTITLKGDRILQVKLQALS